MSGRLNKTDGVGFGNHESFIKKREELQNNINSMNDSIFNQCKGKVYTELDPKDMKAIFGFEAKKESLNEELESVEKALDNEVKKGATKFTG